VDRWDDDATKRALTHLSSRVRVVERKSKSTNETTD